jgi:hypothetical protein
MRASIRLTPELRAAVLRAVRARHPPGNRAGVVGFAIAEDGAGHWSLVVLVRSRPGVARPRLPALEVRLDGVTIEVAPRVKRLRPRKARLRAAARAMPAFTGLHPGAALVTGDGQRSGGVACLLGDGGPTHLLTAGHLFPEGALGMSVRAGPAGSAGSAVGTLVANLLDQEAPGVGSPIDVAVVELNGDGAALAQQTIQDPAFPGGVLGTTEARGRAVTAYRPTIDAPSAEATTGEEPYTAYVDAPARGTYVVTDVLWTNVPISVSGDSGTILLTADAAPAAVGTCVGLLSDTYSLFEPLDRALCAIGGLGLSLPSSLWG